MQLPTPNKKQSIIAASVVAVAGLGAGVLFLQPSSQPATRNAEFISQDTVSNVESLPVSEKTAEAAQAAASTNDSSVSSQSTSGSAQTQSAPSSQQSAGGTQQTATTTETAPQTPPARKVISITQRRAPIRDSNNVDIYCVYNFDNGSTEELKRATISNVAGVSIDCDPWTE